MRRAILVAVGLSCILVQAADAYYQTGNTLFEECQNLVSDRPDKSFFLSGTCGGYIVGVQDALEGSGRFCVPQGPGGVNNKQMVDLVMIYLRDHPEIRHLPAAGLVTAALKRKFPCN